ncbi:hypothetical protein VMCG_10006 [Cytospora schulzeri]|uniref:Vegetatible incompatibility protein HET-E-1 n=1 Tax=Cytospora schulzeri TaxID=448051 RepID=A0A423VI46_9PEZI|nr:hypothetical protein VMCG_10006 [Valsa malicola]
MATTQDFSTRRLNNLKRNQALLAGLGLVAQPGGTPRTRFRAAEDPIEPAVKRRRVVTTKFVTPPSRTSARLTSAPVRSSLEEDAIREATVAKTGARRAKKPNSGRAAGASIKKEETLDTKPRKSVTDLDLQASWSSWTPVAPNPERDETGVFHFTSNPDFNPNKSPSELLREGSFGGSYFRPLYSKTLGVIISDDYLELPASWVEGLNVAQYLTSPTYDPEANKFKVMCGQSIEQWEENGWINHQYDVRGWFQWYCRFFMGRRCEDDARQVSRWKKCVGPTGRWRRMLLKKYMTAGVREVWDDGADEDSPEVSPVMHQTCHHWAFEVTQDVLDEYWGNIS